MASEQDLHEQVNLGRLFSRLESSTEWEENDPRAYLRCQKLLQTVKFAKRMLKSVERNKPSDDT